MGHTPLEKIRLFLLEIPMFVKNGEVKMTDADCPDHLCMKQPAVGSSGGFIVCLPNKVVIQGEGGSDSQDSSGGFDAVV